MPAMAAAAVMVAAHLSVLTVVRHGQIRRRARDLAGMTSTNGRGYAAAAST